MKYLSFNILETGEIIEYAKAGIMDGSLYMEVPDDVYETPEAYMYLNGEFIKNPNYIPPETTETITDTDILNVLLGVNE